MKKKSNKKRKNIIYKIISILLIVVSLVFIGTILYMNLLPIKYLVMIIVPIFVFDILNIFLINIKKLKSKIKKVLSAFMVLAILIMSIASFYMLRTVGVLLGNGDSKYKLESYSVIVLSDSKYEDLSDINKEKVGYFENSMGAKKANEELLDEVKVEFSSYASSDSLVTDLLDKKINVIVLEDSIINIMKEEMEDFEKSIKVIYTFKVKIEVKSTLKEAEVTKEPFVVYISGIDTYGEISSVSRSDVNIVMIVNPKTHQILLISIPRDYYVQLHGTTGVKDKLTHAGIYGIDMSIQTIEDLLDLDINYFVKVNFTSVIDIVNALGGLDVYSEYTFISYSGFSFKAGMNYVNGEQALDFARTRKAFANGDRQRGINQQAVIEAIIRKTSSKAIITKYNSLLSAIDGKYQTNMSMKKITALIKMQLNDMPTWTINSYSLSGSDSSNYTYTYNQLLYVMEPDEDSITDAKELINKILNNGNLENSYNGVGGNSNKVTKSYNKSSQSNVSNSNTTEKEVSVSTKKEKNQEISKETKSDEKEKNQDTAKEEKQNEEAEEQEQQNEVVSSEDELDNVEENKDPQEEINDTNLD